MDLFVLDGRQYRSDQPCGGGFTVHCDERSDPSRTMLGAEQLAWLEDGLGSSTARWAVLANQVAMTPTPFATVYSADPWDGYVAERTRLLNMLAEVDSPIVFTGDSHAAAVGRLCEEAPGSPVVGTELMTTSISSLTSNAEAVSNYISSLPQWPYFDSTKRGYLRCDVTPGRWDADFVVVNAVSPTRQPSTVDSRWVVHHGSREPQKR